MDASSLQAFIEDAKPVAGHLVWYGWTHPVTDGSIDETSRVFLCWFDYNTSCQETYHLSYKISIETVDVDSPRHIKGRQRWNRPERAMTETERARVGEAIQKHGQKLFDQHSNLQLITGDVVDGQACLVMVVAGRNLVPCGEQLLPTELEGCPIHVEDGVAVLRDGCERSPASRYFENLHMGINIGNMKAGTLGGFVVPNHSKEVHILTCAHVVYDERDSIKQPSDDTMTIMRKQHAEATSDAVKKLHAERLTLSHGHGDRKIGECTQFVYEANGNVGIDAALIRLTNAARRPSLHWPEYAYESHAALADTTIPTATISVDQLLLHSTEGRCTLHGVGLRADEGLGYFAGDLVDHHTMARWSHRDRFFTEKCGLLGNVILELSVNRAVENTLQTVAEKIGLFCDCNACLQNPQRVWPWNCSSLRPKMDDKSAVFCQQLSIQLDRADKLYGGNSGALMWTWGVDNQLSVAGMFMGTAGIYGIITPIKAIETRLDCKLWYGLESERKERQLE